MDNSVHIIDSDVSKINFKEILSYKELIFMFVKRNFLLSYSQTLLGPLWLIINPLLSATVYFVIFGVIVDLQIENMPKILFYLCGTGLWSLFSNIVSTNSKTFLDNYAIYSKIYFPRLIIPLANAISSFIKYLFSLIPFAIFLIFYLTKKVIKLYLFRFFLIPVLILLVMMIALAIALIFSVITMKYRDFSAIFTLFINLLMYVTPVIYPLSIAKAGIYQKVLLLNPLTIVFESYRYCFLGTGYFDLKYLLISILETLVLLFISFRLFERAAKKSVDIV